MHKVIIYLFSIVSLLFSGRILFVADNSYQLFLGAIGVILPLILIKWNYKGSPLSNVFRHNKPLGLVFYLAILLFFGLETSLLCSLYGLIVDYFGITSALISLSIFVIALLSVLAIDKVNKRG